MADLRKFRKVNHLTQEDIAAIYKCTGQFICNIEKGRSALPDDLLDMLMNNEYGWNTAPLMEMPQADKGFGNSLGLCPSPEEMVEEMERLQDLIEEKNRRIAELEDRERTLSAWINKLLKIGE